MHPCSIRGLRPCCARAGRLLLALFALSRGVAADSRQAHALTSRPRATAVNEVVVEPTSEAGRALANAIGQAAADKRQRPAATGAQRKLEHGVRELRTQVLAERQARLAAPDPSRPSGSLELNNLSAPQLTKVAADGAMHVYVHTSGDPGAAEAALKMAGLTVELIVPQIRVVQGWIAPDRVDALAALDVVTKVALPDYAWRRTGSRTSEGDALLKANLVRQMGAPGPYTGAGIKVGIISDGATNLASAVASGDLPSNITLHPTFRDPGDEATAMCEIVHDLAPGAQLYVAGPASSAEMVAAIQWMIDQGCHVICDDLGFYSQPFFEDGSIAIAARNAVVNSGRVYVSAAGNDAQDHYQGFFSDAGNGLHDYKLGSGVDTGLDITVVPGGTVSVILQWDDRFGASGNDYDLYLGDPSNGQILAGSAADQSGSGNPLEALTWTNTGSTSKSLQILIHRFSGSAKTLELFVLGNGYVADDDAVSADSIFGHAALAEVIGCATINASDGSLSVAASYSSRGPSTMAFPSAESRQTPFITGIDGVSVTGAGGFPNPFYGTSASAPHVAAICALMLQRNPFSTPAQIRTALSASAIDKGIGGFDTTFGYGLADALAAVNQVVLPAPVFTTRPLSKNAMMGESVSFSASAVGLGTLTYQWKHNGAAIVGATSATLNIPAAGLADRGWYQVTATDSVGTNASSTSTCQLNIGFPNSTLVGWGNTTVPIGIENVVALSAGAFHYLVLKSNGTVAAWPASGSSASIVPQNLPSIVAVAGGRSFSVALTTQGTVVGWGDGEGVNVAIPAGLTQIVAIAAGQFHALALKADGTVVAWGTSFDGATLVPAGLTDVVSIACGQDHSLALKANGQVIAWGRTGPSQVPGGLADVASIAAGNNHSLALLKSGTVVGWGSNEYGQISPPANLNGVVALAVGCYVSHAAAVRADGAVVAWGNSYRDATKVPLDLGFAVAGATALESTVALIAPGNFTISTQPESKLASAGNTVALSAVSNGAGPSTFVWSNHNGVLTDGGKFSGAKSGSLTITNLQPADVGNYRATIINNSGGVRSLPATVAVQLPGAPSNDYFAFSRRVEGTAGAVVGSTVGASAELGEPAHTYPTTTSSSVWYSWTAAQTGGIVFTATSSAFSPVVALYSGLSVDGLQPLSYSSQTAGAIVRAGTTVKIAVSSDSANRGDFGLTWQFTPAPDNDEFANAQLLSGASGKSSGTAANATTESSEPNHNPATNSPSSSSVWYRWTPAQSGTAILEITATRIYSELLAIYSGSSLTGLTRLSASAGLGGVVRAKMSVPVVAGTTYSIAVADGQGGGGGTFDLEWRLETPPAIAIAPTSQIAQLGSNASFTVSASGGGLSYKWQRQPSGAIGFIDLANGSIYTGIDSPTLIVNSVTLGMTDDRFRVVVANTLGVLTTDGASLTVINPPPTIASQPTSRSVGVGGSTTFSVVANGGGQLRYQWQRNGADIANASNASYAIAQASVADAGTYTVKVSNDGGGISSAPATLTVLPNPIVYSSRHFVGASGVTAYLALDGTQTKHLLLRALGPTLVTLGATGALADPQIALLDANGVVVTSNDNWETVTGVDLPAIFNQVGATALASGSADAVLYATLAPGAYQVRVSGVGGATGIALLEVFDTDTDSTTRIVYRGTRARVDSTNGLSTALSMTSAANKRLLVRAVGPALNDSTMLADPRVQFVAGATILGGNDNWGDAAPLISAAGQAGAFALPGGSADAAVLVDTRLDAVVYTAQVPAPAGSAGGDVLLEIYDINASGVPAFAPIVVGSPQSTTVSAGNSVTFRALAAGAVGGAYQWRKDTTNIPGATASELSFNALTSDAGNYDVRITTPLGTATSAPATLTVTPAVLAGTHAVVGPGYFAGGNVTVSNRLTYPATTSSLSLSVSLPSGWSYVSSSGNSANVQPAAGASGTLTWTWTTLPPLPITFSYVLNVPATSSGVRTIAASLAAQLTDTSAPMASVAPNPLSVEQITSHSADTDRDFRISLFELTRVIELYNTRNGTSRTGCYKIDAAGEDGFAADATRVSGSVMALARFHSADTRGAATGTARDGAIALFELTRVIELYNTRSGTTRTGQYHVQSGTEDGFAPGP